MSTFKPEVREQLLNHIMSEFTPEGSNAIPILEQYLELTENGRLNVHFLSMVAEYTQMGIIELLNLIRESQKLRSSVEARNVVHVCCTPSCDMLGQGEVVGEVVRILGVNPGQTTDDGSFYLYESECEGYCDQAPMIRINGICFEDVSIENLPQILNSYRLMSV